MSGQTQGMTIHTLPILLLFNGLPPDKTECFTDENQA